MWFWRRVLKVSWTEKVRNEKILERMGTSRELIKLIKQRQLGFVGHIMREQGIESICLTGTSNGKRPKGRPRLTYLDGLVRATEGNFSRTDLMRAARDRDGVSWLPTSNGYGTLIIIIIIIYIYIYIYSQV